MKGLHIYPSILDQLFPLSWNIELFVQRFESKLVLDR